MTRLYFNFPGEANIERDYRVISNTEGLEFDILIFTDSRGTDIEEPGNFEWATELYNKLNTAGHRLLLITRPRRNTGFVTLACFLRQNKHLKFNTLFTNLGIVDFMPMKLKNIQDVNEQSSFCDTQFTFLKYEKCFSNIDGNLIDLYVMDSDDDLLKIFQEIEKNFSQTFLIETPVFHSDIEIARRRPQLFYEQLHKTNEFLLTAAKNNIDVHLVPLGNEASDKGNLLSYDAVHYTRYGHQWMMSKLSKHLDERT